MGINIEELRKKYAITEEQFQENANEIFGELSINAKRMEEPKFILAGGQAGSGKTSLVSKKYKELNGNAIIIDQDELRTMYPREIYQQILANHNDREEFLILNIYIAKMIKELVMRSKAEGYNIILETALNDVEAFIDYTKNLHEDGYRTELSVLSVPPIEGNISMLTRYCYYLEKDGVCRRNTRINPKAIDNIRGNIQKLDDLNIFDDIEIYRRNPDRQELPIQIYSKNKNKYETPLEAFERASRMSMQDTKTTFEEKYTHIKGILEEFGETDKLQILEDIKVSFSNLDERE